MREVLIIGAGVAGLQAAVFTAKAGMDTLVLDGGEPLVCSTDEIQNLVTREQIAGDEIIDTGQSRVRSFGGEIEDATVTAVSRDDDPGPFTVTSESGATYTGEMVIIAAADEFAFLDPLSDELASQTDGGRVAWIDTSN
jgi:Thioredoxin reductase